MAIYLDSNPMFGWRSFAELDRLALSVLAGELGHKIIVPSLVAEELEGQMRRDLKRALDAFETASRRVEDLFDLEYIHTEPGLDIEQALGIWRARLEEAFGQCEVRADDTLDGLRREISGTPPARRPDPKKPAIGGRDAAIWLAVVRDHATRGEPGAFVTGDQGFWEGDEMKPRLVQDLAGIDHPLTLHRSIDSLLIALEPREEVHVDVDDATAQALPLITSGLAHSRVFAQSVFLTEDTADMEFHSVVTGGRIKRVDRARAFGGDRERILLLDATWFVEFRLEYRRDGEWYVVNDLDAVGRVQVYLGPVGAGQFIAAQLKPRQRIWLADDGLIGISRPAD